MASGRRILIISYVLPPSPGIGGRRWAKFAKYLHRNGEQVYLLSAQNPGEKVSEWNKDVAGITGYHFTSRYPKVLASYPSSFCGKIYYRIARYWLKLTVKGNYYDRAARDKNVVLKRAAEIISSHQITHVIVSGAPFHLLHHCIGLKSQSPGLSLVADLRDPWTSDQSISAMRSLDSSRLNAERKMEREVAGSYDLIVTVAERMSAHFRNLAQTGNIVSLPNGFDKEDASDTHPERQVPAEGRVIRLVMAGSIYAGVEVFFDAFLAALKELDRAPVQFRVQIDFAGEMSVDYRRRLQTLSQSERVAVNCHGHIPLEKVHQLIKQAHFGLLLVAKGFEFSFSTKFLEYAMYGTPILLVGNKGELSDYILTHKFGLVFDAETVVTGFSAAMIESFQHYNYGLHSSLDADFNVEQITKKLITELDRIS